MSGFVRYAVYHLPPADAAWAALATRWLGWDAITGRDPAPLTPPPAEAITRDPRRYGLHATLKPPFRLARGATPATLSDAVAALAAHLAPVTIERLALARLGRFLALRPGGDEGALNALAAACVRELDRFRAPPDAADLARRRARGLSPRQEDNLARWGYPDVMADFRFHITLTGSLDPATLHDTERRLADLLTPLLPAPCLLGDIALTGEAEDGRFHLMSRHALRGTPAPTA